MSFLKNKNLEKFNQTRLHDDLEHGTFPHGLHPEYFSLDQDIDFAKLDDSTGVVRTIPDSNYRDYYSVVFEPSNHAMFEPLLEQVSDSVGKMSANHHGNKDPEHLILKATTQVVDKAMKNISRDESVRQVRRQAPEEISPVVALEAFLNDGVGTSEHQAMVAAGLLREYYKMAPNGTGPIDGTIEIDSYKGFGPKTKKVTHRSWVRYTKPSGRVIIIDPASGYFGRLEDSIKESRHDYLRDTDIENPRIFNEVIPVINEIAERDARHQQRLAVKMGRGALGIIRKAEVATEEALLAGSRHLIKAVEKLLPEDANDQAEPKPASQANQARLD